MVEDSAAKDVRPASPSSCCSTWQARIAELERDLHAARVHAANSSQGSSNNVSYIATLQQTIAALEKGFEGTVKDVKQRTTQLQQVQTELEQLAALLASERRNVRPHRPSPRSRAQRAIAEGELAALRQSRAETLQQIVHVRHEAEARLSASQHTSVRRRLNAHSLTPAAHLKQPLHAVQLGCCDLGRADPGQHAVPPQVTAAPV